MSKTSLPKKCKTDRQRVNFSFSKSDKSFFTKKKFIFEIMIKKGKLCRDKLLFFLNKNN